MMTADAKRGIVYLPFGAPADDRVGVDRPGNNLYGSSVVAVEAATGKYLWHFQIVHHDIWDNDAETPPMLFDVRHDGKVIPAIGIFSKNQMLFILDRVTGKPIYGVEERPVPKSDVPGEQTSPTQPFPVRPEPLARMAMRPDEISTITPEHEAFCRKFVADNTIAMGGPYNPPTYNRAMVYFPSTIGALFGGAFDPASGLYIVNTIPLGQVQQITANGQGGFSNAGPANGRFWEPATRMPCQSGSWGDLVAVDVNTGKIAWRSRLGVTDSLPAALQLTGRPSAGGPTTTAGGVTFIAATDDARFRAFDTRNGKEIWSVKLPASAHSVPVSYVAKGKQYIAIVATGGSFLGTPLTSDSLIVYGLD
jgi:quinoprotein glucose dehydrogenase